MQLPPDFRILHTPRNSTDTETTTEFDVNKIIHCESDNHDTHACVSGDSNDKPGTKFWLEGIGTPFFCTETCNEVRVMMGWRPKQVNSDSGGVVAELEGIFNRWVFRTHQDIAPAMLVGLVLATWVQAIWDWRPQVLVCGTSCSGKTTLINLLRGIFGKRVAASLSDLVTVVDSVVVIDESENGKNDRETMELLRGLSSGQTRVRGGNSGKPTVTSATRIAWLASHPMALGDVDKERFIKVDLYPQGLREVGQLKIGFPAEEQIANLGQRSLALAEQLAPSAKLFANKLCKRNVLFARYRQLENCSVPAAMYALATGMTDDQADELLKFMVLTAYYDSAVDSDPFVVDAQEKRSQFTSRPPIASLTSSQLSETSKVDTINQLIDAVENIQRHLETV